MHSNNYHLYLLENSGPIYSQHSHAERENENTLGGPFVGANLFAQWIVDPNCKLLRSDDIVRINSHLKGYTYHLIFTTHLLA